MKIRFNCGVRLRCEHEITKVKLMRLLHYLNNLGWLIHVGCDFQGLVFFFCFFFKYDEIVEVHILDIF